MARELNVNLRDGVLTVNGREVTNPWAKIVIIVLAVGAAMLIGLVIVFVVLPLFGVAVTLAFGLVATLAIGVAAAALLLAFGWPLLVALLVVIGVVKQASHRD